MMESVIVAVLSLLGTMAGAYFANRKSTALVAYRLEQLEKKVDKHNNFAERVPVLEEKVKAMHHLIEDLERER